jgi:tRNA(Ile)-lysidine synthase
MEIWHNFMDAWDIFYKDNSISDGDKILLSVSGGADSICMTHLFHRLSSKKNIKLLIVNFNHNLRKESKEEAVLVKNFADSLQIPCIFESLEIKEYAKEKKVSIETAGREMRYLKLEEIAKKYKFKKIATAHNANDNAETLIMRLLRGSASLAGIPEERKVDKNISIIRPILPIKRKLIDKYVKKNNLKFCNDKSNFETIHTRNKIRLLAFPIFEKINPLFIEHIFSLTSIQAKENIFFDNFTDKCLKKSVKIFKDKIVIDLKIFLKYDNVIKYRVLAKIFPQKKYNAHINLIMSKILEKKSAIYKLSSNWIFIIKENNAKFLKYTDEKFN